MTNLTMPNNVSSTKCALKSLPRLPDVGVPHGNEDGPTTPPRCLEGSGIFFQMTNLTMPNNVSFMKCALKSFPGLPEAGVPHGDEDGPRTPPRCLEG